VDLEWSFVDNYTTYEVFLGDNDKRFIYANFTNKITVPVDIKKVIKPIVPIIAGRLNFIEPDSNCSSNLKKQKPKAFVINLRGKFYVDVLFLFGVLLFITRRPSERGDLCIYTRCFFLRNILQRNCFVLLK